MLNSKRLLLPLVAPFLVLAVACGSVNSAPVAIAGAVDQAAVDRCVTSAQTVADAYGSVATLSAAFSATAAQVVRWQELALDLSGPRPVSPYRGRPQTEGVTVCFFDGQFDKFGKAPGPPGPGTATAPPAVMFYERIIILVQADNSAMFFAAGKTTTLPITDPTRP
jgi:hypothetical protein